MRPSGVGRFVLEQHRKQSQRIRSFQHAQPAALHLLGEELGLGADDMPGVADRLARYCCPQIGIEIGPFRQHRIYAFLTALLAPAARALHGGTIMVLGGLRGVSDRASKGAFNFVHPANRLAAAQRILNLMLRPYRPECRKRRCQSGSTKASHLHDPAGHPIEAPCLTAIPNLPPRPAGTPRNDVSRPRR